MARWISFTALAAVVASLVSIAASDILFTVAILLWVWDCWTQRRLQLKVIPFVVFLAAFFVMCLLAVAFSSDVPASAPYLKKFIKFFYIFLLFTYVTRAQAERALQAVFVVLAASALYGVLQYFWLMDVNLVNRIAGFMGHWMTFSGQLMLGSTALAGHLLFHRLYRPAAVLDKDSLKTAGFVLLLMFFLFVLVLTYTRNAWLGTVGGFFLLLWVYRRRWLLGGVLLLLVIFVALPRDFQHRLYSSFDLTDTTTRIRLELLQTGRNIILAHPWTGLGPRMVPRLYDRYNGTDEFPSWIYQHLHNNFVHIAAEMGILTLAVWIALWMRLLRDFARFARRAGDDSFARSVALGGMAVVTAFLLAGLFEYNFGDSEILILLIFFITIPYVVDASRETAA